MEIQKVNYRIIVNNSYEISFDDFVKWFGFSEKVARMIIVQNIYQSMSDGSLITFEYDRQEESANT